MGEIDAVIGFFQKAIIALIVLVGIAAVANVCGPAYGAGVIGGLFSALLFSASAKIVHLEKGYRDGMLTVVMLFAVVSWLVLIVSIAGCL